MELAEDDAPVASKRPPRRFTVKIRRVGQDIVMEELVRFLNARGRLTPNCLTGKFFSFFSLPEVFCKLSKPVRKASGTSSKYITNLILL